MKVAGTKGDRGNPVVECPNKAARPISTGSTPKLAAVWLITGKMPK